MTAISGKDISGLYTELDMNTDPAHCFRHFVREVEYGEVGSFRFELLYDTGAGPTYEGAVPYVPTEDTERYFRMTMDLERQTGLKSSENKVYVFDLMDFTETVGVTTSYFAYWRTGGVPKFSVDIDGNCTAAKFIGDGSLLTNLPGGGGGASVVYVDAQDAATLAAANAYTDAEITALNVSQYATIANVDAADAALDLRLDAIEADYTTSVELSAALAAYETAVHAAATFATITDLGNETTARSNADNALDGRLDTVEATLGGIDVANIAYVDVVNAFVARQDINAPALAGAGATSILTLAQTWNTTGAPSALEINITDTASDASSELISFTVNGIGVFGVRKDGTFITSNAILETVEYGFTGITSSTMAGFSIKEIGGPYLQLSATDHLALQINEVTFIKMDNAAFHPETTNTMTVGTATEMFLGGFFTSLNIGHASDTTITRAGAGRLGVEAETVAFLSDIEDTAFAASWNTVTDKTATKNALHDAIAPHTITIEMETGANKTKRLVRRAAYPFRIDSFQAVQTTSGTITVDIQINGVNVTGLSALAVNSGSQNFTATALRDVAINDEVTIVFSSNAAAVDFRGALMFTKTG